MASPMKDYAKRGLFCEYEYCIEEQPFDGESACPTWGHDCPGGVAKAETCGKTIDDIPEKRWATKECNNCKYFKNKVDGKEYFCGFYIANKSKGSFYCNEHQYNI